MRTSTFLLCCLAGLLHACANQTITQNDPSPPCDRAAESGAVTRLAMIRKLQEEGHPYAALAHLDGAGVKGATADHLRADILRRTGQITQARTLYQGLLTTCMVGAGHHGLGLLAGEEGRLTESLDHLKQARRALPVDARIRNDLGYALLLSGDLEGAKPELLTAQDLDPEDRKAASNLLMLFDLQGDENRVAAIVQRYQIGPEELHRLRSEAGQIKSSKENRP